MGRLTLNVLLSFAQFEREVTGERIRDKIAASKPKGMWMGGAVPFGYKVEDRKLLINPKEAELVRYIFNRYLQLKSILKLTDDLAHKGIKTRQRTVASGKNIGGVCFGRGALNLLLKNPIYIGKIRHKEAVYDGEHQAIIDAEAFAQVQALMADNTYDKRISKQAKSPSLLAGLITDPDGRPMSPARGQRGDKHYCYYVTRVKPGEDRTDLYRLPAGEVDRIVLDVLKNHLGSVRSSEESGCSIQWQRETQAAKRIADTLDQMPRHALKTLLLDHQTHVHVTEDSIDVAFTSNGMPANISIPARLVRRGHQLRISLPPENRPTNAHYADPGLLKLIAQGFAARDTLLGGKASAAIINYDRKHLYKLARISWLAPDIISDILNGTQPVQLTARHLLRCADIPLDWNEQRQFLGFS